MNLRSSAGLVGVALLAGCGGPAGSEPTASEPEGRWISVWVENAGDPDHHLSVVDDRDVERVVGIAEPAMVPGRTTMRVRFFVPDDIPWMVSSNDLLLLTSGDVHGFCGSLPITMHVNWGAGSVELPIWMGEPTGFPGRPPDDCDAVERDR